MKMTFTAVGDMLVQSRIHSGSIGFSEIQEHLQKSDAGTKLDEAGNHRLQKTHPPA